MIRRKRNQELPDQHLTSRTQAWLILEILQELILRWGRMWQDFDSEVRRWKQENWNGWVPFVLALMVSFALARVIGFGAAYSVVADEPPSDWLSYLSDPAMVLGRWDVLLFGGSFFLFPLLALLGYRLMRRPVAWLDIAGGWVSGACALPVFGLFSGCAQAATTLGHFRGSTVGVAGMIGAGVFILWKQFRGVGSGTGTGSGIALLAGCVGFTASTLAGALTATLATPFVTCGGEDGGSGGTNSASKDALWESWVATNVQIAEKKCSVAFACYQDLAKQRLRGSVEACKQFPKDNYRKPPLDSSSISKDLETCLLAEVPTLERCAAAINSYDDKVLCQKMEEQTFVFKYSEFPECASIAGSDAVVKCGVVIPAPERGSQ